MLWPDDVLIVTPILVLDTIKNGMRRIIEHKRCGSSFDVIHHDEVPFKSLMRERPLRSAGEAEAAVIADRCWLGVLVYCSSWIVRGCGFSCKEVGRLNGRRSGRQLRNE